MGVGVFSGCCVVRSKATPHPHPEEWKVVKELKAPAHEGPVFAPPYLYYTTTPATYSKPDIAIERLNVETGEITTFRKKDVANMPNGMVICPPPSGDNKASNEGSSSIVAEFYTCEQGFKEAPARITRTSIKADGSEQYSVIVEENEAEGLHLNSPNDICVSEIDGSLWFTDPSYGSLQGFRHHPPKAPNAIYRYNADDEELRMVVDLGYDGEDHHSKNKPNGICLSPDERYLYFTNTSAAYPGESYCECRFRSIWKIKLNPARSGCVKGTLEKVCDINPPDPNLQAIPDGLKWVGGHIVTSCGNDLVFVDPNTSEIVHRKSLSCEEVTNFALSPDGEQLAVVGNDKVVILACAATAK